jgi:hypothetical protein
MCQLQPIPELASLRFAVTSLAQLAGSHGSHESENADNAARGINSRITWVIEKLEELKARDRPLTATEARKTSGDMCTNFMDSVAKAMDLKCPNHGTETCEWLIKEISARHDQTRGPMTLHGNLQTFNNFVDQLAIAMGVRITDNTSTARGHLLTLVKGMANRGNDLPPMSASTGPDK